MFPLRPLQRYQLVVDLCVAGVFGLLALAVELAGTTSGALAPLAVVGENVGAVLVALALTAALAMRRLQPGIALVLAWVGAFVQMGFGRQPSPTDLAIFAVLYTTAAYGSRRVFWWGFASGIAGAAIVPLYLVGRGLSEPLTVNDWFAAGALLLASGFALMLAWVSGALVRTALRAAANSRAQRAAEAETIAEQQRVRIARDMHDVVAHSLAVVIAQADGARYAAGADPAVASEALATISTTARAALTDVRLLLGQLRHSQGEGPQPTLADLDQLFDRVRAAGVDLDVRIDPAPPGEPPAAIQMAVYRIMQEALTNALRHGVDPRVRVRLGWFAERVELSVRNARSTSSSGSAAPGGGHGLIGMRERAQLVGGRLTAGPEYGEFVVQATLPIGPPR
ncbi:Signal transduction histidine kinase [Microbacterium sp. ru370.1]|uniref:sensor histidine kinase n=1 Tax=unclassified Microbacterium TaxID=2609290 RepID=UPI000889EB2B|nr:MULTISPECIES: histidine kinase [unclassified Microbacterium]SDO43939.1 Signal transduction histidine kinase [Microbacterium sp. ru370.1]SIT80802.1 Signal transduction histidine kinase [Microbacterium sp. RU1D]